MEFRDLRKQYDYNIEKIQAGIQNVLTSTHFIQGEQVEELEKILADFVGVRHCITCANGTDALQLALMAWGIGEGDAVFVPDFTFFSSGEVVAAVGATPVFVDVALDTYNVDVNSLEKMIEKTISEGRLKPKVIIAVDLFGQPADYELIRVIAQRHQLYILEDAAQGFGGAIKETKACAFGHIATTSFFPAKPFGCYGDGGAIFTDDDEWAGILQSLKVHGKGTSKYDNVRIGMNSRLDTIQAAVLLAKFPIFKKEELVNSNRIAKLYTSELQGVVTTPVVRDGYFSSWAQYTVQLAGSDTRDRIQAYLNEHGIPSAVYYQKPMHKQKAFGEFHYEDEDYSNTNLLCNSVLSLPFHPYMEEFEVCRIADKIKEYGESVNG